MFEVKTVINSQIATQIEKDYLSGMTKKEVGEKHQLPPGYVDAILRSRDIPIRRRGGRKVKPKASTHYQLYGYSQTEEDKYLEEIIAKYSIGDLLEMLTPREGRTVCMRLGLCGYKKSNYQKIGMAFCVSNERARQVYHKAFRKTQRFIDDGKIPLKGEGKYEEPERCEETFEPIDIPDLLDDNLDEEAIDRLFDNLLTTDDCEDYE